LERSSSEFLDRFPFFNFNVSHHGDWVVLASEPNHLVGIDVMKIEKRRSEATTDFFAAMENCFTNSEWKVIKQQSQNEYEQLSQFYTHWTLKESYIKAVGIGLGFDLQSCSFSIHQNGKAASISIHSKPFDPNWTFHIYPESEFAKEHVVSIGFGPISDAQIDFLKTFPKKNLDLNNNNTTTTTTPLPQRIPFEQLTSINLLEK